MAIVQFIALFIATWFTVINTAKILCGNGKVPAGNLFLQALGISVFAFITWC